MGLIERSQHLRYLHTALKRYPIVAILGARQVGKTTLARQFASSRSGKLTYFDLEDARDGARLADSMLGLADLRGLVIIDEIQRAPEIFATLRVLADRPRTPARFLLLGSASPQLLRQSSETLAGRVAYHRLDGFSLGEVGSENWQKLWLRGGFPRAYLATSHKASNEWRRDFIRTFLERDIPQLGIRIQTSSLRRFWSMLAHYHGQIWNSSEFARSFGVADTTVRGYLDVLTNALVVTQLQPWFENVGKRQVKAPKYYVTDSGLLHSLLGLVSRADLDGHPKVGASWEGFAINQLIEHLGAQPEECFYWATHAGAELDLLIVRGNKRRGFEIKRTSSPRTTPSMRNALADLRLQRLDVIHAGSDTFPLAEKIRAVSLSQILSEIRPL